MQFQSVTKIAVLRANAVGDFIFALPALEALRQTYPAAEIVLLGLDWHAAFLKNRPSPIDRVVVIPRSRGVRGNANTEDNPPELADFFAKMVAEKFDVAIQMHGGGRYSNPFVLRLGAKTTVGLKTPDAVPLDFWVPYIYYQPEILRYLEVVSLLGAKTTQLEPHLAVTSADLAEAQSIVSIDEKPLVALHPGATDSRRWWSVEKFAAVGDAVVDAGAEVVVTGTHSERELVETAIASMKTQARGKIHNLCDRLSLGGLAGLYKLCKVVVSNDSGPLHIAAAVGCATVGIYWCGNLMTAGPMTRSRHRPAISWRLHCPVCGVDCTRDSCDHRNSFVDDVSVQEVVESVLELLGHKSTTNE
ncbi:glycosyltransferase family 9 protein [Tolypothrix bouteillei]|nr:glycosyltransferase family 9 protein [Tolypothrix bouteillei]